jgi:hypothetical protein
MQKTISLGPQGGKRATDRKDGAPLQAIKHLRGLLMHMGVSPDLRTSLVGAGSNSHRKAVDHRSGTRNSPSASL